jgi:hypothetical protein
MADKQQSRITIRMTEEKMDMLNIIHQQLNLISKSDTIRLIIEVLYNRIQKSENS